MTRFLPDGAGSSTIATDDITRCSFSAPFEVQPY